MCTKELLYHFKICLDKTSCSSEVTEFNTIEKLSLPAEGVVQVNSNLVTADNNNVNSIVTDSIQEQQTRIPESERLPREARPGVKESEIKKKIS